MRVLVSVFMEEEGNVSRVVDEACGRALWCPPLADYIKINVDAGACRENETGIGVIARDAFGSVLAVVSTRVAGKRSVLHAELMAIEEGLRVAELLKARKVILESDCLFAVKALKKLVCYRNETAIIVNNLLIKVGKFPSFCWCHVKRKGNSVAHYLAKNRLCAAISHWFDAIPICIKNLISVDSSVE